MTDTVKRSRFRPSLTTWILIGLVAGVALGHGTSARPWATASTS
jgi:hypothetical protein